MATDLEMHFQPYKALYADVYADPLVAARKAELGVEHQQFREQVRELMLEPEWNQ